MKKIKNPYQKVDNYNCFGCSPNNPIGLHLTFTVDHNEVVSYWTPTHQYEGWCNILHGGIQATLMDEISSWVVFSLLKTSGYTVKMNVQLHKKIFINDGTLEIRASLRNKKMNLAIIEVKILNAHQEVCSEGEFTYFTYSNEIAKERFYFPENEQDLFED